MKKPKPSSSATPPQSSTKKVVISSKMKKAKSARNADIKTSGVEKLSPPAAAAAADPIVEAWKKERREARRFPTVFELTQITAILSAGTYWQEYWHESDGPKEQWSVAAAAASIWEHCGRILDDKIGRAIYCAEMAQEPDLEPLDIPNWLWARNEEKFPLDFDKALEYIVGKKVRKPDRYAQFRAFMRAQIKDPTIEEEKRMAIATRRFTELKTGGFSQESFERAGGLFDQWKAIQAKEKARKAAAARWGK